MTNSVKQIFKTMLTSLETHMSAVDFDVWIKTLSPVNIMGDTLVLCATSSRMRNFVTEKFKGVLELELQKVNPLLEKVSIIEPSEKESLKTGELIFESAQAANSTSTQKNSDVINQSANTLSQSSATLDDIDSTQLPRTDFTPINPKYNFETFVVGKSNQFMYAGASSVAESPGTHYNPLFIYGGPGLGKTHIMHAIGNSVQINHPHKKIAFVSSDKFLNEFIEFVRKGKGKEFRDRYREIDVLMIDDIQFIAGKPGVQEELFHTFNALYASEKQLVFTSDRAPKDIRDLEERLQSRFSGGLMVDVQLPDVETRTAILQKKAYALNAIIEPKVLAYMAEQVSSNVRELEGLLNRVVFLTRLNELPASIETVIEAMAESELNSVEAVSAARVIECVCSYFNVTRADLISKKKTKEIAEPRQICMYLINEIVGLPLAKVGDEFGGRDHTTVMHARNKVLGLLQTNVKIKLAVTDIKEMLNK